MSDGFGERVSPIAAIRAILHDYPFSASIIRELLQNSDDAKATKQIFVLDTGKDPALLAYNDSQFHEEDWKAIQTIHESSKRVDTSKIGKYGVGFRACYHVTDKPEILSGSSFAILDPIHSGGQRIDCNNFNKTDHRKHFDFFSDIFESSTRTFEFPLGSSIYSNILKSSFLGISDMFESSSFTGMFRLPLNSGPFSFFRGTVIRLPLRSSPSELSERIVRVQELDQMIKDYIAEELNVSLLFLNNLRTIEIWKVHDTNKTCLAMWTKSERTAERQSTNSSPFTYNLVLSNGDEAFSWQIIQIQNIEDDAKRRLSDQVCGMAVTRVWEKHKLSPDVRIAYPLFSDGYKSGRLFTFLPLPSKTDFPVHIHALFALTSSRQSLRNRNETGNVAGSDNDVLIKWNSLIFDYYVPQAWSHLLKTLAEGTICGDIFSSWPPYLSSITSGDGLYWQNILKATFNFAVQSGLAIWPKVSTTDTTTYVDLKPSLVVTRGQVDSDVLIALAQVGLTLVQLPKIHMDLLDDSITKMTPRVARDHIKLHRLVVNDLSENQRRVLCKYFLSDKDFSNIYGLPLFPALDGSYISLDDREATDRRYIALTTEEIVIFGVSADDAISLDQLQPELAALVREQGTTHANIDLLSPPHVIAYLSSQSEARSDEDLSKFWSWLSEWRHREQAMMLFKENSSLRLIPTSKGPQLVSSPIFRVLGHVLFEKLGLAFINPLLPGTVIQFLSNYKVTKDPNDMNDFLAAIDLAALQPLSDDEAKSVFDHISIRYKSLSDDNLIKLKKLPIFPVLVSNMNQPPAISYTSVKWRAIDVLNIKGISPMSLIPLTAEINFLDKSCFSNPSSSLLNALQLPVLKDEDVLLLALEQFSSQPKSLRASFVSYIRQNHPSTSSIISALQKTRFVRSLSGTLQSPIEIIDPNSGLKGLFPDGCLIPSVEDDYDCRILDDLRNLGIMQASLSSDIVKERISYVSSNRTSADALVIARSLLSLMNNPNFVCFGVSIDPFVQWLPTRVGLVSAKDCVDSGRRDTDLFDEVLATLDETIMISPSFRALLNWDKPLPLCILTRQLNRVLGQPSSETQYRKVREIIREVAGRQLLDADIEALHEAIAERPWVPTESGILVPSSRAVFIGIPGSSFLYEIGFSHAERQICSFLLKMGCHERPSVSAIIREQGKLREKAGTDRTVVKQAVQFLEMLPDSITDEERASLLVPTNTGELVPFHTGVCYYKGTINIDDGKTTIGHHFISEKLAEKIGMKHLGLDKAGDDIDLGGKPIIIVRNILRQYDPKQFLTEFIANASDAHAKQIGILIDNYDGPTECLLSDELAVFQNASLVVHNDGIFSQNDFKGILQTGVGGKRGRAGVIGHFGLGALSMFHFTELAMIVSGDQVLFLSPSKRNLSFCGKHSLLLPLQNMKRLYPDHLKPLDGLFGFDLSSAESYQGTLFRLPLRNELHSSQDSVSTTLWSIIKIQEMLLAEFDKVAYKSILFTGLGCIGVHKRQNGVVELLRTVKSTRTGDNSASGHSFKSETVTFESTLLPTWLVITMDVNIPENFKARLAKKYDMHHLLPIRIAAALDSDNVQSMEYNLFCTLPLPITTPLPAHISAPLILEQERRNVRIDGDQTEIETEYNHWLLSSEVPRLYLCLLEKLLHLKGTNITWWPGAHGHDYTNALSQILMNAFWSSEILEKSSKRIFANKYDPTSFLSPSDVILFSEDAPEYSTCKSALSKVLSATRPSNIAEFPVHLFDYAHKAQLHILDGAFLKALLKHADPPSQWLNMDEIDALTRYLLNEEVPLDGLSLILREDGSCAKIDSQYTKTNYVVGSEQVAAYDLFHPNRLLHRKFSPSRDLMKLGVNVSCLDDAGVVELVAERIAPAHEWVADETHQTWIASFWDARLHDRLNVCLERISHFPLIPTFQASKFISIDRINDHSVTVVGAEKGTEGFSYAILQKLGMTVILGTRLPEDSSVLNKKLTPYRSFLQHVQKNEAKGLEEILSLKSSDREELARWVRSKFSETPANLTDVACQLPVWPIQQRARKLARLGALKGTTILPGPISSDALLPFTDHTVMDWDECMKGVMKTGCSARHITEILRISHGTILRSHGDRAAYWKFIKGFLGFDKLYGYSLLVPNEEGVLTPVESLFERCELFLAAFRTTPEHLLSDDFQDIAFRLQKYGLNLKNRLDLATFIECAKAFDQDNEYDEDEDNEDKADGQGRRRRSKILYRHFNDLSLCREDVGRCSRLDGLKFIPRDSAMRAGYDGMNIRKYMQPDILSPSKIALIRYEPICWSQRGRVESQPNLTLCGTYQNLGKPTGKEVKHLKVLVELGKKYGHRSALLSDLKATYKWLNDNVDEILVDIKNENQKSIFLNVDDPVADPWVWHSASTLVKDLQDVGELHGVKTFLRNYDNLLNAAGVRRIQKITAEPTAATDRTSLYRSRFRDLREQEFEVDVTFKAMDNEHQIRRAHKAWLILNSQYFWRKFVSPDFREVDPGKQARVDMPDYSSLCVKETVDWVYVGELSKSIITPSSNDQESKKKLDLTLDMLSLAHRWEVTELHQRLQEFIINAPGFINPYWVEDIREHAELLEAEKLLRACKDFEEKNQDIIHEARG